MNAGDRVTMPVASVDALIGALRAAGYVVAGPTIREEAIVYDEIRSAADLPAGWTDVQGAGSYRLARSDDDALFGYAVGPHSWKKYLFPPVASLFHASRTPDGFTATPPDPDDWTPHAFLGVRSCEIHAIAIQDRIFLDGPYVDPVYKARRDSTLIVAVNCSVAGGTCFCSSMGTGPAASSGYDLALTELGDSTLLVEIGSERGGAMMAGVPASSAGDDAVARAGEVVARTAASMGRTMDTTGIKELLYSNLEHPRWDDVAARCLSCTNCTMVCPTCFCATVEDASDLSGDAWERTRVWDSCFTAEHSYVHGGSVRPSTRSRYRQWMTHKLATWIDQFGTSGCVGCGRCITWCPVGIDITEEVAAIRSSERADDGNA